MRAATTDTRARQRARRVYLTVVAVATLATALVALGLAAVVGTLQRQTCAPGPTLEGCLRLDPPALLVLALATLGLVGLGVGLICLVRQVRAERWLLRSLVLVPGAPHGRAVRVVAADAPLAFCAGMLRPVVYVSTGMVALLGEEELAAVLAHEHEHRRARDPLRLAAVRACGRALFFLPVVGRLGAAYASVAELGADEAAVAACRGQQRPLASALMTLTADADPSVLGVAPERLDHLMGRAPGRVLPGRAVVLGTASLLAFGACAGLAHWAVGRGLADAVTLATQLPAFVLLTGAVLFAARVRRRAGRRAIAA